MSEGLEFCGTMHGHTDMVTAIATPMDINNSEIIVTSSRDKSIIMWDLTNKDDDDYGVPCLRLTGHSRSVQDVTLSSDAQYALSSSCDGELRLWDLADGTSLRRFIGHKKGVLSVAFSMDYNRQIASASRDRTIKLWNIQGECKYTVEEREEDGDEEEEGDGEGDSHSDWVICVRFGHESLVSCSRYGTVKVWDLKFNNLELRHTLDGHTGYVNCIGVSPDGSVCASGGDGGVIPIWDLAEGKRLFSFDVESNVHALCFCPTRYWLCAATDHSIRIWDLKSKDIRQDLKVPIDINEEENDDESIYCTSLSWSADGNTLFGGYSDGVVRVWAIPTYLESDKSSILDKVEVARKHFGKVNTIVMNAIMDACVHCVDLDSTLKIFHEMKNPTGCGVDTVIYATHLKGFGCEARRINEAFQLLEFVENGTAMGSPKLSAYSLLNQSTKRASSNIQTSSPKQENNSMVSPKAMLKEMSQRPSDTKLESPTKKLKHDNLSNTKYLAGDFYSLADLSHIETHYFMQTPCASMINDHPHLKAWWMDISSRPAFIKVVGGMTLHQKTLHISIFYFISLKFNPTFCPSRYWLCAATDHSIRIWDLKSKDILQDLKVPIDINEEENDDESIHCTSLSWSADGNTLFGGYSDGVVRVWAIPTFVKRVVF
ncbi:uncharacterized protein LOC133311804 [Gastrolobium bilobum]|uniref:uncharacterized protein LOC133311804 n=1 Tax=Gastrolobium bilobum TaxID=150636 RepID=UPI002AB0A523|nr:uncharacterized protein LOC133311804 [Gastrolobium bilobum]